MWSRGSWVDRRRCTLRDRWTTTWSRWQRSRSTRCGARPEPRLGLAGMINLGLVGFFALGAYVSALLTKRGGAPMPLGSRGRWCSPRRPAPSMALLDRAAARRLSRHHDARLLRGRADRRQQRDLADQRHRRHLRHARPVARPRDAGGVQSDLPRPRGRVVGGRGASRAPARALLAVRARAPRHPRRRPGRRGGGQAASCASRSRPSRSARRSSALAGALYGHYTSFIAPDVFVPLVTHLRRPGPHGRRHRQQLRRRASAPFLVVFFLEGTRFATGWLPGLKPVQVGRRARAPDRREPAHRPALPRPAGLLPERIPRVEAPR